MAAFENKVFIVTGAAGNLGQAVARGLYAGGATLVLAGLDVEDHFADTFPELVGEPERVMVQAADLTDDEVVSRLVQKVIKRFGRIDGLANIVGGYRAGTPVHETPLETLEFMFNLNARTTFLVSRAVVPHMIERGQGKIVNIGARVALKGGKNAAAYSMAKTAVVRLTESLSDEVKVHGINVNAVLPGTIDTPENRKAMPDADFGRWVKPQALADVILFLLSDAARAVHGAAIPVYGLS